MPVFEAWHFSIDSTKIPPILTYVDFLLIRLIVGFEDMAFRENLSTDGSLKILQKILFFLPLLFFHSYSFCSHRSVLILSFMANMEDLCPSVAKCSVWPWGAAGRSGAVGSPGHCGWFAPDSGCWGDLMCPRGCAHVVIHLMGATSVVHQAQKQCLATAGGCGQQHIFSSNESKQLSTSTFCTLREIIVSLQEYK